MPWMQSLRIRFDTLTAKGMNHVFGVNAWKEGALNRIRRVERSVVLVRHQGVIDEILRALVEHLGVLAASCC